MTHLVLEKFRAVDLTHVLDENVPTWTGRCGFRLEIKMDYEQGLRAQTVKSHAGVGTHMDAPSHFIRGSANISDIPLEHLIVPAYVYKVEAAAGHFIDPKEIESYEKKEGAIPKGALFIASTGWEKRWKEPALYRNAGADGRMRFPGFSSDAADYLIEKGVHGIGIDTLSPDGSNNDRFPVHEKILGAGKYILENLAHLDQMPAVGAFAIALPPRTSQATESVCRVVGFILH